MLSFDQCLVMMCSRCSFSGERVFVNVNAEGINIDRRSLRCFHLYETVLFAGPVLDEVLQPPSLFCVLFLCVFCVCHCYNWLLAQLCVCSLCSCILNPRLLKV